MLADRQANIEEYRKKLEEIDKMQKEKEELLELKRKQKESQLKKVMDNHKKIEMEKLEKATKKV